MKAIIILMSLLSQAEGNYQHAMYAVSLSDQTDYEIEKIMASYGFEVDAMDTTQVSMGAKIKALRPSSVSHGIFTFKSVGEYKEYLTDMGYNERSAKVIALTEFKVVPVSSEYIALMED